MGIQKSPRPTSALGSLPKLTSSPGLIPVAFRSFKSWASCSGAIALTALHSTMIVPKQTQSGSSSSVSFRGFGGSRICPDHPGPNGRAQDVRASLARRGSCDSQSKLRRI